MTAHWAVLSGQLLDLVEAKCRFLVSRPHDYVAKLAKDIFLFFQKGRALVEFETKCHAKDVVTSYFEGWHVESISNKCSYT